MTENLKSETASLSRRLNKRKKALRLILEREAEYVLKTDIPLDLIKGKQEAEEEIEELEQHLEELKQSTPPSKVSPLHSHPKPEQYEVLSSDRIIWKKDGKEMVRVPAGKFLYGNAKEKRELDEFWIDKTPVTNIEYAHFVAATDHEPPEYWKGETPPEEIGDFPVFLIPWHQAIAYAEWAGKRMPTEEEWEKATRGIDGRKYPWGDDPPMPELCNFDRRDGDITRVGTYSPQGDSPYGCVDMVGNGWEWAQSEYGYPAFCGGDIDSFTPGAGHCASRSVAIPDPRYGGGSFRAVVMVPFSPPKGSQPE
jgi:formylglycine-generating enzyme required for sulfatase activity